MTNRKAQSAPRLTDRIALGARRARARRHGPETFLHDIAIGEVKERIELVNRRFTSTAIVTPFPELWAPHFPGARVTTDRPTLDLEPGAHDLVVHAMALHWADDPVGQLVQARRALKPDGLFLGVLPGGRTLAELRATLAEWEVATLGGLSPRVAPMTDIRDAGQLLQRAGFALPVADSVVQTVAYGSLRGLIRDLRHMGETNVLAARHRQPLPRGFWTAAEDIYRRHFADPDGRLVATFEMLFLAGWCPHESQQKPLRPGAAAHRLADALGTTEYGPDDAQRTATEDNREGTS